MMTTQSRSFLNKLFGKGQTGPAHSDEAMLADAAMEGLSISALLGGAKSQARDRMQIYQKWQEMSADAVVSTALRAHITAALGGHETSGDLVFIELNARFKNDKKKAQLVEEIRADLAPLLNSAAFTVAFNGAAFGDAYARVYGEKGAGVVDLHIDEMVHPSTVIPYEQGSRTVGYVVASGAQQLAKLTLHQMARLKMPRTVFTPQMRVVDKILKQTLTQDDVRLLPILPSLAGGSLLSGAEDPFDKLSSTLAGLVGQRVLDSIDESMLTVNMANMTEGQRGQFMKNIREILTASKQRAQEAVRTGRPFLSRIYHLIPIWGEKQLTAVSGSLSGGSGRGQSGNISIEDVMFHAKLLAGALGTDLSMLGFADLLSGGLGDGGYFRTSSQAAERARTIRVALTEFFEQIINIHTFFRYGIVLGPRERPWQINFYGSISALEAERQRTRSDAMSTGAMLAQTLAQFKDLSLSEGTLVEILSKIMQLDEEQASLIARDMTSAAAESGEE